MTGLTRFIMSTVNAGLSAFGIRDDSEGANSDPFVGPAVEDVLIVKNILQIRGRLPIELIDCIIDYAEYWPHTTTFTTAPQTASGQVRGRLNLIENQLALRSLPLGYSPAKSDIYIPLKEYLETPAETDYHYLENLDPSWTTTDDILTHWTDRSQTRGETPCRKITFTLRSSDQGWGGHPAQRGTYEGSYSWFDVGKEQIEIVDKDKVDPRQYSTSGHPQCELGDAENGEEIRGHFFCILRPLDPVVVDVPSAGPQQAYAHPLLPPSTKLQLNVTAQRLTKEHVITWSYQDDIQPDSLEGDHLEKVGRGRASGNGEYVRNLRVGDIITVWARARFPGWQNNVEHVRIDVYWAV